MRKGDMAKTLADNTDISKEKASQTIDAIIGIITEALERKDDVVLTGFGTFKRRTRSARQGKNPQTGEVMNIPESDTVSFKPGKKLKEVINE